jgi:hypothetical protein
MHRYFSADSLMAVVDALGGMANKKNVIRPKIWPKPWILEIK